MSTINSAPSSNEISIIGSLLVDLLEGKIALEIVLAELKEWLSVDFGHAPNERRILRNDLEDQFEIEVRDAHIRNMLKRFQNGEVGAAELSNWAAFVILSGVYVPTGGSEEEQWEEGEGPVWDILQRLMTPSVFGGLDCSVAERYIAILEE